MAGYCPLGNLNSSIEWEYSQGNRANNHNYLILLKVIKSVPKILFNFHAIALEIPKGILLCRADGLTHLNFGSTPDFILSQHTKCREIFHL